MARQITCECGYVARGAADDDVVALIEEHIASDHPDLAPSVSQEKIRQWIEIVPA